MVKMIKKKNNFLSLLPIVCGTKLEKLAKLSTPEKKEHFRNVKTLAEGRGLQIMCSPTITQSNASLIGKDRFITRKALEAWHTKLTPDVDNNSYCHQHLDNITYFLTSNPNYLHSY